MQIDNDIIEIKSSRIQLSVFFIVTALFVAVGVWFVLEPKRGVSPLFQNIILIRIIGVVCVVFFGLCGLFILRKLGDKKAAFIISNEGVTDRTNATSIGFILWADVVAIRETAVINQKFVTIDVKDPEYYINLQTSLVKRKLMQINYQQYGSLISISANALQCHHQQLKTLLEDAFKKYQASQKQA